jgi:hypothetical protein
VRKSLSFLALSLLIGAAACEFSTEGDEPDGGSAEGRGNGTVGPRGTAVDPANADGGGATVRDAGTSSTDAGGAAADASAPTAAGDAGLSALPREQCALPLATASVACDLPDVFEPNDEKETAVTVPTGDGCFLVPGKLTPDNEDYYRFITDRADPVLVQLAYEATASSAANIKLLVTDPMGGNAGAAGGDRADLAELATVMFVSKRGFAYTVNLYDNGNKACQGYNLRVDPNFCRDAFEDNDSRDKAARGLTYDSKLEATIFPGDDDWYDVGAIQASGARCTVAAALTLSSPATLTFRFRSGTGSVVAAGDLSGSSPSKTVTLPPGSAAAALEVTAGGRVCTSYSMLCTAL